MYSRLSRVSRPLKTTLAILTVASGSLLTYNHFYLNQSSLLYSDTKPLKTSLNSEEDLQKIANGSYKPPSRSELLSNLEKTKKFDVLIIGGGATGTGCAVDASTRGLNVALMEMNDFASATSSKSTKMAHGGVRYLEKAVFQLSKAQLDLVIEALNERKHMLQTAPHLCKILPIMIPVYNYWEVPYFYAGCKMYDFFAGSQNLKSAYLLSKTSAGQIAPMLDVPKLKAALVYHDGSFNDARMNVSLAVTAIENGATVLNYMEVEKLIKDPKTGKIQGATVRDRETDKKYDVMAKVVVNSTGPFSDNILQMDRNKSGYPDIFDKANIDTSKLPSIDHDNLSRIAVDNPKMVVPSAGVHIILPSYYCPKDMGILDVKTADGRVMFFLPWQDKVLAGTTDIPMKKVPENPVATEADIEDILSELQHYCKFPVKREDVLSAWAGIRPLVRDPRKLSPNSKGDDSTQGLVRSHFIFTSENNLVTIAGGKWTTYRRMAEETIDEAIKVGQLPNKPSVTKDLILSGGENWTPNTAALLSQKYHIPSSLSKYLSENYGTRAPIICELLKKDKKNELPVTLAGKEHNEILGNVDFQALRYPYTVAEVKYCIDNEYSRTALDFLLRRTRFGFLDAKEAMNAVEGTVSIMGDELNWDSEKRSLEIKKSKEYIKTLGV
ncbi:hypothetical protein TBLA_0E01750 [Henningerozyma blattae CBS 6284]|uniref:Glycerol-3-phosphate dehydrogenase n=1 Tax=Henningerozyma blattae (strain ATCC 34711 / CBS 6284 / DSM 70876 / NBRC 10599 / NRRL Y-10934 / UCD 77-7) TaxID=1071380 RepID=I2H4C9_HENB6|nr:hypothetical protein TBLA_0E01750 [Tetrapisispora blattae CBS 6284]CCH61231.1 hypothetical protein TBLA_0E01750 [Tetrapisispora blattae CBS 6284]